MTGMQVVDVINQFGVEEYTMRKLKSETTSIIKMAEERGNSFKAK